MKYFRVFGKWYISPEDRGGCEVTDDGSAALMFDGLEDGAQILVDGRRVRAERGNITLSAKEGSHEITVLLPSGEAQAAEDVLILGGRLLPSGFCRDDFLLELAERVQALEAAEAQDRRALKKINDKNSGKYFLGGTIQ